MSEQSTSRTKRGFYLYPFSPSRDRHGQAKDPTPQQESLKSYRCACQCRSSTRHCSTVSSAWADPSCRSKGRVKKLIRSRLSLILPTDWYIHNSWALPMLVNVHGQLHAFPTWSWQVPQSVNSCCPKVLFPYSWKGWQMVTRRYLKSPWVLWGRVELLRLCFWYHHLITFVPRNLVAVDPSVAREYYTRDILTPLAALLPKVCIGIHSFLFMFSQNSILYHDVDHTNAWSSAYGCPYCRWRR